MNTAREQERIDALRALRDFALEAVRQSPGHEVHEAALDAVAAQVYELLNGLDVANLKPRLQDDPASYTSLVNTLARLSLAALSYQKYRAEVAERKAKLEQALAAVKQGGLTPEAVEHFQQQLRLL